MATSSEQLITRVTVILEKPEHWSNWLFLRKTQAQEDDIWDYVNPDLNQEEVARLEDKPVARPYGDFHRAAMPERQEADITDLTAQERTTYDMWYREYVQEKAQWTQTRKALNRFKVEVSKTIAVRHIHLIEDCESAHDQMQKLKEHLCPTKPERNQQLLAKYQGLRTQSRQYNLDVWFDEWLETTQLMTRAGLAETEGNRLQQDFILAVKSLDDGWATSELRELVKSERLGREYISISHLVADFASYYRRTKPIASGLGSFATLGIAQKNRLVVCLCGEKHKFEDCLYVNKSLRPKDWKPVKEIEQAFQELRLSETPKAIVLQSVEKRLASSDREPKPIARWDDGKMPEVHGRSLDW